MERAWRRGGANPGSSSSRGASASTNRCCSPRSTERDHSRCDGARPRHARTAQVGTLRRPASRRQCASGVRDRKWSPATIRSTTVAVRSERALDDDGRFWRSGKTGGADAECGSAAPRIPMEGSESARPVEHDRGSEVRHDQGLLDRSTRSTGWWLGAHVGFGRARAGCVGGGAGLYFGRRWFDRPQVRSRRGSTGPRTICHEEES